MKEAMLALQQQPPSQPQAHFAAPSSGRIRIVANQFQTMAVTNETNSDED